MFIRLTLVCEFLCVRPKHCDFKYLMTSKWRRKKKFFFNYANDQQLKFLIGFFVARSNLDWSRIFKTHLLNIWHFFDSLCSLRAMSVRMGLIFKAEEAVTTFQLLMVNKLQPALLIVYHLGHLCSVAPWLKPDCLESEQPWTGQTN